MEVGNANQRPSLIPIRVEFETYMHRIITRNMNETLLKYEMKKMKKKRHSAMSFPA